MSGSTQNSQAANSRGPCKQVGALKAGRVQKNRNVADPCSRSARADDQPTVNRGGFFFARGQEIQIRPGAVKASVEECVFTVRVKEQYRKQAYETSESMKKLNLRGFNFND